MVNSKQLVLILSFLVILSGCQPSKTWELSTREAIWQINDKGFFTAIVPNPTSTNVLSADTIAPLLSIGIGDEVLLPQRADYDSSSGALSLYFQDNNSINLECKVYESHLSLKIVSVDTEQAIDYVVWGPYPLNISDTIGETVGVVRGNGTAVGIQSLNPKTLGGYPWKENDCMPQIDIFDQEDPTDLTEEGKRYVLYRVEAAIPTHYGSSLQAYCRNRNETRIIENWGHKQYVAPPHTDGGILGSGIALFACPTQHALSTIGVIERQEKLPHPQIDGVWGKQSLTANAAYMILGFGSDNIEKAVSLTKKAGLRYLYHPGPFLNWGHFELDPKQFPDGYQSMKYCADQAASNDIMLGVHTLSNFITTNDPYVTPIPDNRLAKVGSSKLSEAVSIDTKEILIASPNFFNQHKNDHLRTVQIGDELIRYASVSEQEPWVLKDCQRGAFGTTASKHSKGHDVYKLADHAYKVFLSNIELSIEMAENIATLFNETGLRQISFDGLEGNRSTAMGNYGEILFTDTWYNSLNSNIRSHYIADASRTSHYFWHMYSRMNWGEPWYAGFRESQTTYRLKNQEYFRRNYMPGMLGWFSMRPETSIEDIEWMLARSVAFDAGYGFSTSYASLESNGNSDRILKLLGEWEKIRLHKLVPVELKREMEDTQREFHLITRSAKSWDLYEVHIDRFTHQNFEKQPGEPTHSNYQFENPLSDRNLQFIISAVDGPLGSISLELDNYKEINLDVHLAEGERLKYVGGKEIIHYSPQWKIIEKFAIDPGIFHLTKGSHQILFDSKSASKGKASIELRIQGDAVHLEMP